MRLTTSKPSTFGRPRSTMTTSGRSLFHRRSACAPSLASSTTKRSRRSTYAVMSRMSWSSSTSRIFVIAPPTVCHNFGALRPLRQQQSRGRADHVYANGGGRSLNIQEQKYYRESSDTCTLHTSLTTRCAFGQNGTPPSSEYSSGAADRAQGRDGA